MYVSTHAYQGAHVEARGQVVGVGYLLPLHGSQVELRTSGLFTALLPTEPSPAPSF